MKATRYKPDQGYVKPAKRVSFRKYLSEKARSLFQKATGETHPKISPHQHHSYRPLSSKSQRQFTVQNDDSLHDYIKPISQKEKDLFRMKAIKALEADDTLFPTFKDMIDCLHNTPISITELNASISLQQELTPFPGKTIIIRGEFQKNSSIPIPQSFEVISDS